MASRRNNSSGAWSGSLLNLVNAGGGSGRSLAADRRTAESDAASDLDLDLELPPPPPITVMDRVDATTAAEVTYRMRQALRRRSLGSRRQLTFSSGLVASGSQMDADARVRHHAATSTGAGAPSARSLPRSSASRASATSPAASACSARNRLHRSASGAGQGASGDGVEMAAKVVPLRSKRPRSIC